MLAIDSLLSGESIAGPMGFEPIFTWINSPVPYQVGDGPICQRGNLPLWLILWNYIIYFGRSQLGKTCLARERTLSAYRHETAGGFVPPLYPASAAR